MNAVNLIPADSRRRPGAVSTSKQTLALFTGLVLVLVAVVLYVSAANDVSGRKADLARVTASANSWKSAAASYGSIVKDAQQRTQELADVRQLVADRFPWESLLSQIGNVMPATSALNSLQATTASATPTAGTGSPSTSSSAPVPAVQLAGCAASQPAVAATMVALRRVQGVTAVTLSSSSGTGATGSPAGGGCPFPIQFQLSLTFSSSTLSSDTAVSSQPAAAAASTASAASTPSSASAAAPASATPSTGVQAQ